MAKQNAQSTTAQQVDLTYDELLMLLPFVNDKSFVAVPVVLLFLLDAHELKLYLILAMHMWYCNNQYEASTSYLAKLAKMAERTIYNIIKRLEAKGIIHVKRRRINRNRNAVNVYSVVGKGSGVVLNTDADVQPEDLPHTKSSKPKTEPQATAPEAAATEQAPTTDHVATAPEAVTTEQAPTTDHVATAPEAVTAEQPAATDTVATAPEAVATEQAPTTDHVATAPQAAAAEQPATTDHAAAALNAVAPENETQATAPLAAQDAVDTPASTPETPASEVQDAQQLHQMHHPTALNAVKVVQEMQRTIHNTTHTTHDDDDETIFSSNQDNLFNKNSKAKLVATDSGSHEKSLNANDSQGAPPEPTANPSPASSTTQTQVPPEENTTPTPASSTTQTQVPPEENTTPTLASSTTQTQATPEENTTPTLASSTTQTQATPEENTNPSPAMANDTTKPEALLKGDPLVIRLLRINDINPSSIIKYKLGLLPIDRVQEVIRASHVAEARGVIRATRQAWIVHHLSRNESVASWLRDEYNPSAKPKSTPSAQQQADVQADILTQPDETGPSEQTIVYPTYDDFVQDGSDPSYVPPWMRSKPEPPPPPPKREYRRDVDAETIWAATVKESARRHSEVTEIVNSTRFLGMDGDTMVIGVTNANLIFYLRELDPQFGKIYKTLYEIAGREVPYRFEECD